MKHLKYIAITIAGLIISKVNAQEPQKSYVQNNPTYSTALGLRGGLTSGITLKHFTSGNTAIEGIIGIRPFGMSITGLFEFYYPIATDGLQWYYGFGGHAAFRTGGAYYNDRMRGNRFDRELDYQRTDLGMGVDGIVGIEYKIPPIPFAISLDLKPFIEFNTSGRVYIALDPGLGVKFTF